jgi:guanylate kinase
LASSTGTNGGERQLPVFVVTGQSGAGKGTLIKRLLAEFPQLELAVSATTRAQREGEIDGVDYRFLTEDEFDRRVASDDFLEWVHYVGHRYGTLLSEVERLRNADNAPVLELETEGALSVAERVPGAITIFITAPLEELERRLRGRATENPGEIEERIRVAGRQLEVAERFDHVVENDDLERATADLSAIVERALHAAATMTG